MCYRKVQCVRHKCGHDVPYEETRIDCNAVNCRYSSSHRPHCPSCPDICKQWLAPAVKVSDKTLDSNCVHCAH
ncbi:hypothetical protein BKA70DRAFT_1271545 [Coprinopsis sp. MPI-PUGE-AT-0042]|nr:hypothetical protein BKA70DRAFT_1271545 [Coprinopsis sp. MPI-PUGE-AT-0042]